MPIEIQNDPSVPSPPAATDAPAQPGAPADPPAPAVDGAEKKPAKAKRARAASKRKAPAAPKDSEAPPAQPADEDEDALAPLPADATGFRKRAKADDYKPVQSSSIPQLSVGEVRKCLNQIRKAGSNIRSEHLLWNGWPAGKFALAFLMGNHIKRKSRKDSGDEEGDEGEPEAESAEPVAA